MATTALTRAPALANVARLFQALSDETRLSILDLLGHGERCVCDLQDALGAAQSRLSFHLKVLREAGLVSDRKDGRWSYYAIDRERVEEAAGFLQQLEPSRSRVARPVLHRLTRGPAPGRSRKAVGATSRGGCCS
ncbi:MAG: ArsR/SmtB family transcription factor [Gemmatimonadales bacterium]